MYTPHMRAHTHTHKLQPCQRLEPKHDSRMAADCNFSEPPSATAVTTQSGLAECQRNAIAEKPFPGLGAAADQP